MLIHLQSKVAQLLSSEIPKFYAMILNMKEENIDIAPSQKWKVQTSVSLQNVLSAQQDCLPLCYMSKRMMTKVTEKLFHSFKLDICLCLLLENTFQENVLNL